MRIEMKTGRRTVSSELSAEWVDYILKKTGMSQEKLADTPEVSPGFVSLLRSRVRSLTMDHLELIEELMQMPLGALLLAASPPPRLEGLSC